MKGGSKLIAEVQEGQMCYYKIMQSYDNRKIDILSWTKMKKLCNNIVFVGNKIAIELEGQTMFFSQYDFMLKNIALYTGLKKLENEYPLTKAEVEQIKEEKKNKNNSKK